MNFYQEITIIPEPEIPAYSIWGRLYQQLHIALADIKNSQGIDSVGVSFPGYQYNEKQGKTFATLGYKLRIFAPSEAELQALNLDKWLERLTDYVHIKRIQPIPSEHGFVMVRRYRYKTLEKQAQDFAAHRGISYEDALAHCQAHKRAAKPYPFIQMTSQTNQRDYRLAIIQKAAEDEHRGSFNSYGINNATDRVTVPHW